MGIDFKGIAWNVGISEEKNVRIVARNGNCSY